MNLTEAQQSISTGKSLVVLQESGIPNCPTKSFIHKVRPLPRRIAAIRPARLTDGYQTLVNVIGGRAWINVAPRMVAFA